jgi:hypothetical protein
MTCRQFNPFIFVTQASEFSIAQVLPSSELIRQSLHCIVYYASSDLATVLRSVLRGVIRVVVGDYIRERVCIVLYSFGLTLYILHWTVA